MNDLEYLVIAPAAGCRTNGHRLLTVPVADATGVEGVEACAVCTELYRGAIKAGEAEEIGDALVKWGRQYTPEEIADGLFGWAIQPSGNDSQ